MATMNDIAKVAGVSRGTVSNVLERTGLCQLRKDPDGRRRGRQAWLQPDKRASTLRKGVSGSIAPHYPRHFRKKYSDIYMGRPGSGQRI